MMWYEIPDFSGYRINHQCEILSMRQGDPKIMKPWVADGYRRIILRRNGKYVNCKIAALMLTTFVSPRPEGQEVCHGPGGSLDDRLSNIRWGTRLENAQDQILHGTHHEASRTQCDEGHDYTPQNSMWRYGKGGKTSGIKYRKCKECHRLAIARYRARKKAGLV